MGLSIVPFTTWKLVSQREREREREETKPDRKTEAMVVL
jgi:hypothetical protein